MRSTLATTVKCLGAVREKLTKEHLKTMKKTPFYLLLLAIYKDQLTTSQCRKMDNNIVSVVQLFNARTRSVKLGMEEVGFSITDVKYIFGIVDGKREIVVSKGGKKKTAFVERLFPKGQKLEQKLLKERLDELVQKREHVDIEDTVRILCLILISSLFFCSTGLRIPWGWVDFVENLDEMKSYDWCGKILSTLLDSMTAKKEKPSKINGCTLFLLYWLCEHATIVTPKPRNPTMTVPRVLKWNLPDLWTKVTKDRLMNLTRDQSFVKKNMDDAALVYNDFVEAQKIGARYVFFPMNSTGPSLGGDPYHWTLLVWDFVAEKWSHYNSLKPRQPAGFDPWFDDAIFLKNKIESSTKPPPDYGLTTQDISVAIHNVAEVPQQAPNMNECALYVCYFMTQLVRGLPIDANIDCQTFRKFKAHVVESIITRKWLQ